MLFQQYFQNAEIPEEKHTTCAVYQTGADGKYPLHCHSYYELSYVIKGERYESLNGISYHATKNTLIFIPPLAFHTNINVRETDVALIQFSSNFLKGNSTEMKNSLILSSPPNASPLFFLDENGASFEVMQHIVKFCLSHKSFSSAASTALLSEQFEINGLLLELLSALIKEHHLVLSEGINDATRIPHLDRIIEHILAHPAERTDMATAAQMAHMSYYSFSRIFKESVGINFSDYCNLLRIRLAEDKLITTDLPIADISAQIGIETPSYFSRLFKKINHVSPLEFRNMHRHT